MREAIVDGWLACAPPALADEYLAAARSALTAGDVRRDERVGRAGPQRARA